MHEFCSAVMATRNATLGNKCNLYDRRISFHVRTILFPQSNQFLTCPAAIPQAPAAPLMTTVWLAPAVMCALSLMPK